MQATETLTVPASAAVVFALVSDLSTYPGWLRLVHEAETEVSGEAAAWSVELRARIGPFARSKRLRMVLAEQSLDERVVFERRELDGRDHANWMLRAELVALDATTTDLTMHLSYDGRLWTGGLLERALDEEIRQGRERLVELVNPATTR